MPDPALVYLVIKSNHGRKLTKEELETTEKWTFLKGIPSQKVAIANHPFKVIVISPVAWKELAHYSLGHVNY